MLARFCLMMTPFLLATEGSTAAGGGSPPIEPPKPPPPPPPPPPAPELATVSEVKRVTRESVKEEPPAGPVAMLVNETDRVLCFAHSAFHATLVGGASVPVPTEALAELIHGEIQRIERGGAKTGFKLVAV